MDDATRERLQAAAKQPQSMVTVLRRDLAEALDAVYGLERALEAERAPVAHVTDAQAARLEAIRASLGLTLRDKARLIAIREDHLGEALDIADALLAERAQAAPVLAAAEAWVEEHVVRGRCPSVVCHKLRDAVAAWRAAREG